MFLVDLARGDDIATLNAQFHEQVETWRLAWRCRDCVFLMGNGACSTGWPNANLIDAVDALDTKGEPVFCKSFEADGA